MEPNRPEKGTNEEVSNLKGHKENEKPMEKGNQIKSGEG